MRRSPARGMGPLHIKTGAALKPPAPRGVASYPVRVQGSDVEVEV